MSTSLPFYDDALLPMTDDEIFSFTSTTSPMLPVQQHQQLSIPSSNHFQPLPQQHFVPIPIQAQQQQQPVAAVAIVSSSPSATIPTVAIAQSSPVLMGRPSTACSICYAHRVKCNGARPCERCVRHHRSDKCLDRIPGEPLVRTTGRRGRRLKVDIENQQNQSIAPTAPTVSTAVKAPKQAAAVTTSVGVAKPTKSVAKKAIRKGSIAPTPTLTTTPLPSSTTTSVSSPPIIASIVTATPTIASAGTITRTKYHHNNDVVDAVDAVDAAPIITSSSSSSSIRHRSPSSSRSPARKISRRHSPVPSIRHITTTTTTTTSRSPTNGTSMTTMGSMLASLPRMIPQWNETQISRRAITLSLPWLADHIYATYRSDVVDFDHGPYGWVTKLLNSTRWPRACPHWYVYRPRSVHNVLTICVLVSWFDSKKS
jgi:hypothetical protein